MEKVMDKGFLNCDKGLFLVGKDYNQIKGENGKKDGGYYKLEFADGGSRKVIVTCGEGWDVEVEPNVKVHFDPSMLAFGQQYDVTFDVNNDKGYTQLKLRTWKAIGNMASPATIKLEKKILTAKMPEQPATKPEQPVNEQQTLPGTDKKSK